MSSAGEAKVKYNHGSKLKLQTINKKVCINDTNFIINMVSAGSPS